MRAPDMKPTQEMIIAYLHHKQNSALLFDLYIRATATAYGLVISFHAFAETHERLVLPELYRMCNECEWELIRQMHHIVENQVYVSYRVEPHPERFR